MRYTIGEAEATTYTQDINVECPATARFMEPFEFAVDIENRSADPTNLMVSLNAPDGFESKREAKSGEARCFLVVGMVNQQVNLLGKQRYRLAFRLMPIKLGRCALPGVKVEQRVPSTGASQLVFDSTGLKAMLVVP